MPPHDQYLAGKFFLTATYCRVLEYSHARRRLPAGSHSAGVAMKQAVDDKATIEAHLHLCAVARDLLLQVGAIQRCPAHPHVFYLGQSDVNGVWPVAERLFTAGTLPLPHGMRWSDFAGIIAQVHQDHRHLTFCYTCDAMPVK